MHLKFLCTTCLMASSAMADVEMRFIEGAPKDRFVVTNLSDCTLKDQTMTLDLNTSAGGLIFDVTRTGAGVEVFQPFELVTGAESLATLPKVLDGDRMINLSLQSLAPGAEVAFTIDVDDTGGGREITVNGTEMAGATLQVGDGEKGVFGTNNRASVSIAECVS